MKAVKRFDPSMNVRLVPLPCLDPSRDSRVRAPQLAPLKVATPRRNALFSISGAQKNLSWLTYDETALLHATLA